MFSKHIIKSQDNLFEELANSTKFEESSKGRKGAVLVLANSKPNILVPIVRTSTKYNIPAQHFKPVHDVVITQIKKTTQSDVYFNNGLIEIYDNNYTTMGFHSDQAQDLDPDSYICLFSCYSNPGTNNIRSLKIKNKTTEELSEISLDHNSIVLFSVKTNNNYLHKIVLDGFNPNPNSNSNSNPNPNPELSKDMWLGLTVRLSKTIIHFINEIPYFYKTNIVLRLASQEEAKEFYSLRHKENKSIGFEYPELDYTISMSDLLPVN